MERLSVGEDKEGLKFCESIQKTPLPSANECGFVVLFQFLRPEHRLNRTASHWQGWMASMKNWTGTAVL